MQNRKESIETELVALLKRAFAQRLSSVVVYGSYVTASWQAKASDINVLILLDECSVAALEQLGRTGHRFLRRNRITPLILSQTEFSRSADVFPMEYMDIIAQHRVLYGGDPTEHVQFSRRNLRHQLEHQLRGMMVGYRQLVVAARGRKRLLAAELRSSAGQVAALFRGLLRLHGIDAVPSDHQALVEQVGQAYGADVGPFVQLLALRQGAGTEPQQLLRELQPAVARLITIVDQYEIDR